MKSNKRPRNYNLSDEARQRRREYIKFRLWLLITKPFRFIIGLPETIRDAKYYRGLDWECRYCEVLGMCRDKKNGWAFREGEPYIDGCKPMKKRRRF